MPTQPTSVTNRSLDRVDPELRPFSDAVVETFSAPRVGERRARMDATCAEIAAAVDTTGVGVTGVTIVGPDGDDLALRVYRGDTEPAPLVLYAHGGSFIMGNLDTDHGHCVELARSAKVTVVSVEYRLAPENPCPAALNDVAAAFGHIVAHPGDFGVDTDRLAVMGRDAGAGLVAGLSQRVFDEEGPTISLQILHQPLLDTDPTRSRAEFGQAPVLDGPGKDWAWRHYLGGQPVGPDTVPAHRTNLEGLPPAFISCAEVDPARDEAIQYAQRLLGAYVSTELHVTAKTFHGFDSVNPEWAASKEIRALYAAAIRRILRTPA